MNLDDSLRDKAAINGTFEDTSAMAQAIKMVFRRGRNWDALPPESKESLELTASMLAMILNGDATEEKHWNNAAGYLRMRGKGLEGAIEKDVSTLARLRTTRTSFGLPAAQPEEDGAA